MSQARDHSYYEIALTNRQVMSIFIVLLVCLLASFVSGVWIGRQGAGVRVQTADAQLIEAGSGDGEELGEMDFFSDPAADPAAVAAEPPSTAEPTREEPVAAEPPPADPVAPAVSEPPATAASESPAPPPAAAAEPSPSTAGTPATAAASEQFLYIQVFSSPDRVQANSIVDSLRGDGYAAFLSSVEVGSRLMYRVRIGPYTERPEAEQVAQTVQRKHKLSTWITP